MSVLQLYNPLMWPMALSGNSNFASFGSLTIDVAGEKVGQTFCAPKSGNISKIWWRTTTVTTGDTVDVRLETVSTTDGNPTGTLFGTTTNIGVVVDAADDQKVFKSTLTAAAAVTKGEPLCLVIANGSTPGNMTITLGPRNNLFQNHNEYPLLYTTSWTKQNPTIGSVAFALEYDDGSVVIPWTSIMAGDGTDAIGANRAITSGTQAGAKFTMPFSCKTRGAKAVVAASATRGDVQFKLYHSSDLTNPIASSNSIDGDMSRITADFNHLIHPFTTDVYLTKGQVYYLVVEAATNTVNLRYFQSNSGDEGMLPEHDVFFVAHRAGTTGSFTEVANDFPLVCLLCQMDDGTGFGKANLSIGI